MHLILSLVPILDRLGGFRFKWARKYVIPILLAYLFRDLGWMWFCNMALLGAIFSFNFDAIENRNWGAVFCKGLAISWCFVPLLGYWSIVLSQTWFWLILWSNKKFLGFKLDWAYVEILRLAALPLLYVLSR